MNVTVRGRCDRPLRSDDLSERGKASKATNRRAMQLTPSLAYTETDKTNLYYATWRPKMDKALPPSLTS